MAAGIEIYNYVTNQKGSPAIYSDVLANRPAAGFIGRLFVSTNTLEIYRDNGTTWDLLSGGGGGGVNIYNSDGTLTGTRVMTMAGHNLTFEGGANVSRVAMSADNNVPRIFSFRTAGSPRWAFRVDGNETGLNTGSDWALRAYDDAGAFTFAPITAARNTGEKTFYAQENLTVGTAALAGVFNIAGGTYGAGLTFIGGNAHAAQFNNFTLANGGSFTFAASSFVGANGNVLRLQANATGTVTFTPASPGIRTAAVSLNQIQYNTSGGAALTYTHASVLQTLGILQLVTSGSLTVANAYGLIINDLNEYGYLSTGPGALILTNRWGIYQDSTTDVNYFGGTTLIGTTTNAGYKIDVSGTMRVSNTVTLSSLSGVGTRVVTADASGVLSTTAIPGGIGGSGTVNRVVKFTAATTVGDSQIFDNGTNVGVGTTSPNAKLEVFDGSIFANQDRAIAWNVAGSGTLRAYILGTSGNELQFWNRQGGINTQAMTIGGTGNVGIGTASPTNAKLVVEGSSAGTVGAIMSTDAAGTTSFVRMVGDVGSQNLINWQDGTALRFATSNQNYGTFAERLRIFANGNIGINTTADDGNRLQVQGNAIVRQTSGQVLLTLQTGATGNTKLKFAGPANFPAILETNTGQGGILFQTAGVSNFGFIEGNNFTIGFAATAGTYTNTLAIGNGTAPTATSLNTFTMYCADVVAGNASPHILTENGALLKLYQETTAVAAATFTANSGTAVNDASTFDGYTLKQIVKALRNLGILQ